MLFPNPSLLITLAHNKWLLESREELFLLVLVVGSFIPWISTTEIRRATLHSWSCALWLNASHLPWNSSQVGEIGVCLCLQHRFHALRGMLGVRAIPQILLYLRDLAFCKQAKPLAVCLLRSSFFHSKCLCLNWHCGRISLKNEAFSRYVSLAQLYFWMLNSSACWELRAFWYIQDFLCHVNIMENTWVSTVLGKKHFSCL